MKWTQTKIVKESATDFSYDVAVTGFAGDMSATAFFAHLQKQMRPGYIITVTDEDLGLNVRIDNGKVYGSFRAPVPPCPEKRYRIFRKQSKPLMVGVTYPWEEVTDQQVIDSFPPGTGIIPQRFAATMVKMQAKGIATYYTLSYTWRAEEIPT